MIHEEYIGKDCYVRLHVNPLLGGHTITSLTIVIKAKERRVVKEEFTGMTSWVRTTTEYPVEYSTLSFELNSSSIKRAIDVFLVGGSRYLLEYQQYLLNNIERILELGNKLLVKEML